MNYQSSAAYILSRTPIRPTIAIVTGSGLGALADALADAVTIPYADIPDFPRTTVEGHTGELRLGTLRDQPVCILRGRTHFYEGYTPQQATFYVRVLRALGVETLILTNAAGGLNPKFVAGDLMLINDHINMVGMAGFNPLYGPNDTTLGPRFPAMNPAYDPTLRKLAKTIASELGILLHEGIYAAVAGPSFETAAELRMLRLLGGDAVGMSTANETIVAVHSGMKVLGLSLISNPATGEPADERFTAEELHHEVLEAGQKAAPKMIRLIEEVVGRE
jgi:purine-nucleoside phosphorylase